MTDAVVALADFFIGPELLAQIMTQLLEALGELAQVVQAKQKNAPNFGFFGRKSCRLGQPAQEFRVFVEQDGRHRRHIQRVISQHMT